MPPVALRKLLAYYRHNTHWTERVEALLLDLVYYTVNMNRGPNTPPVGIDKFRPAYKRTPEAAGSPEQTADTAERAAAAYGQHL